MSLPLKEIVQDLRTLEPFPGVATRVLELASREQVVPSELIEVIQLDPALTAKVLRLCNSAYYGFQREISTHAYRRQRDIDAGTRRIVGVNHLPGDAEAEDDATTDWPQILALYDQLVAATRSPRNCSKASKA